MSTAGVFSSIYLWCDLVNEKTLEDLSAINSFTGLLFGQFVVSLNTCLTLSYLRELSIVRTGQPYHSCHNENFTFNQNYPARLVNSRIIYTGLMRVFFSETP